MYWEKIGLIFCANHQFDWMQTHASLPIAKHLYEDVFRIYFSTRDAANRSNGAFIDIDINQPKEILNISDSPIVIPGNLGLFDDSGISLSCFVNDKMYYLGWHLLRTVPFSNQIGLIDIKDSEYHKHSILPILGKCKNEPFTYGYPWVIIQNGLYRMWYDVILSWENGSLDNYVSELRYAESYDGINWNKKYINCISKLDGEISISRPCVIYEQEKYKIWYSVNYKGKYFIGYSESTDGIKWERKDSEVGISVSNEGWDSEEIEYPFVFDHKGERYLLYNGNGYGKTGFGLAILKS